MLETFAKKLGLKDSSVLRKAKEIEKLVDAKKSAALDLTASLQCVLCLQVAARMKGVEFDKDLAIKVSATGKKLYNQRLFTIEKLLDLEPDASVKDMCLKLGISHLAKTAESVKSKFDAQADADDVNHPMYCAGAVWVVAKSQKVPIEKSKIVELARTNWNKLESVIEKMKKIQATPSTPSSAKKTKVAKKHVFQEIIDNMNADNDAELSNDDGISKEEDEDYDVWRKRMIQEAQEEMKQEAKRAKTEM